jgi:hypothetical protein
MAVKTRFHKKIGGELFNYLVANKRDFVVEKTKMGTPTIVLGDKNFYIREKPVTKGSLGRISQFQAQVRRSSLYDFVDSQTRQEINDETEAITRSLLWKGFNFNPSEKKIEKALYVDLNSAYWQGCKTMGLIDEEIFEDINKNYQKKSRLKMVGTLGKQDRVIEYKNGEKSISYAKPVSKDKCVSRNVYERLRKLIDELMIWVYQQNPDNFIGYYVDCFWLREVDFDVMAQIEHLFNVKMAVCDLKIVYNRHHSISVVMTTDDDIKKYDVQLRRLKFDNYQFLHNFDTPFNNLKFDVLWKTMTKKS